MNVLWRFVEVQGVEREDLRKWWHHHNLLDVGHIYWRHQWAAEQATETWTIPVLSSAIINSELVDTPQAATTAIRLLSNTPTASQLGQQRYHAFMEDLRRSYDDLVNDVDAQAFRNNLEAIQRK